MVNMTVKDYSDGPVTPGVVASASSLIGGQFNTALPTLSNNQQSAIQLDSSGRQLVTVSNIPVTVDTNYGTVGASTIRVASEIGNATGAANFNAGTTGAQTLRVAANIYDDAANGITSTLINSKQRLDVNLASEGTDGAAQPFGTIQVGGEDPNGNLRSLATNTSGDLLVDGNVASGVADSGSPVKIGGVYNSSLPTLSTGERVDMQTDSLGRVIVANVNKYMHLAGAATTTVKSGAGYLHAICCNNATSSSVITVYDNTAASGNLIAVITMGTGTSAQAFTQIFDIAFTTGLTIVRTVSGTSITVSYQ